MARDGAREVARAPRPRSPGRAMASSATRLVGAVRRAGACAATRLVGAALRRAKASSARQLVDALRRLGEAVRRCAAPGGGQLGDAARRRCAAPGGDAARRRAAPGDGGAVTSREGGVDDGSSGMAHPARPARTGQCPRPRLAEGEVRGREAVVVTAPALVGAWRVRATPEEIVMFHAQTIAHEFVAAVRPVIAAVKPQDGKPRRPSSSARRPAPRSTSPRATARAGRDRVARFRIASGECGEAVDALRLAVGFGYVADGAIADALGLGDRLCAMLWRLTHPRP
jgi:hypothetical protein